MIKKTVVGIKVMLIVMVFRGEAQTDYPVKPVPFTRVKINDTFWLQRMETNRTVTIPIAFKQCEETGRVDNFSKAAGLMEDSFRGLYPFDDTDIYKILEGVSYSLSMYPDPELEKYLDNLIQKISAAKDDDGYLYTWRALKPEGDPLWAGPERWSKLGRSHELYCSGHLYEAADAHYTATGKRTLLEVAIKNADLIIQVFGPDKIRSTPGHPIVEMGLIKLYRITGNEKYLSLAKFFIDERGYPHAGRKLYGEYALDHKPVLEQDEAVGHAVRAVYLYSGMADVGALLNDKKYVRAIDKIWENVVTKKLYLTGGIGAVGEPGYATGEAFGKNYELPNLTAYNETCAAIGNVMWNHRLFLLHGDGKYIDVLERILYNGLLSGVSLSGDRFFYPNPLACDGKFKFNDGSLTRKEWFGCACCPGNITRFIASFPGYVYAMKDGEIYVNLFVKSSSQMEIGTNDVEMIQDTRYPWDGKVKIVVNPSASEKFLINIRIPGWARNQPLPGDLYRYLEKSNEKVTLKLNGNPVDYTVENGYASMEREWKKGDEIELNFPMSVRRILCNEKVVANRDKVAIERGPLVYCAEGIDNGGHVLDFVVSDEINFSGEFREDMLGGVTVIKSINNKLVLVPYYAWSNRGTGEMTVWFKRK